MACSPGNRCKSQTKDQNDQEIKVYQEMQQEWVRMIERNWGCGFSWTVLLAPGPDPDLSDLPEDSDLGLCLTLL